MVSAQRPRWGTPTHSCWRWRWRRRPHWRSALLSFGRIGLRWRRWRRWLPAGTLAPRSRAPASSWQSRATEHPSRALLTHALRRQQPSSTKFRMACVLPLAVPPRMAPNRQCCGSRRSTPGRRGRRRGRGRRDRRQGQGWAQPTAAAAAAAASFSSVVEEPSAEHMRPRSSSAQCRPSYPPASPPPLLRPLPPPPTSSAAVAAPSSVGCSYCLCCCLRRHSMSSSTAISVSILPARPPPAHRRRLHLCLLRGLCSRLDALRCVRKARCCCCVRGARCCSRRRLGPGRRPRLARAGAEAAAVAPLRGSQRQLPAGSPPEEVLSRFPRLIGRCLLLHEPAHGHTIPPPLTVRKATISSTSCSPSSSSSSSSSSGSIWRSARLSPLSCAYSRSIWLDRIFSRSSHVSSAAAYPASEQKLNLARVHFMVDDGLSCVDLRSGRGWPSHPHCRHLVMAVLAFFERPDALCALSLAHRVG